MFVGKITHSREEIRLNYINLKLTLQLSSQFQFWVHFYYRCILRTKYKVVTHNSVFMQDLMYTQNEHKEE